MFKIIRRISYGVIPRPDRPWEEDPTSSAPHRNRKRRLSISDRDDADDEQLGKKRVRGDSASPSVVDADTPLPADVEEVREVTQGVKKVDLDEKKEHSNEPSDEGDDAAPESVPLPDDEDGELDERAGNSAEDSSATLEVSEGSTVTHPVLEADDCTSDTANVTPNEVTEGSKEETTSEVVEPVSQGSQK